MSEPLPVIDLEPWFHGAPRQRAALASEVGRIAHEIGFFYVLNHGIAPSVSNRYLQTIKDFFALPPEDKQAIDKRNSRHFRGWERLGSELTNNETDFREQIDIGVDRQAFENPDPYYMALIGPNQWPDEQALPGFRATVEDYFMRLAELSRQLLRLLSLSLGLDEFHIERVFGEEPSPYLKLIRYPPTARGEHGVGVHKDSGFLTLLLQDGHRGLEAQANDGSWYPVDPLPGSLVVNSGELLQLISSNYFIATPHRVINRGDTARFSCAFFYSPDLNTRLEALPIPAQFAARVAASARHRDEGLMASRAELLAGTPGMASRARPAVFGEKYWQRWVRSYPEIARRFYPGLVD